MRQGREALDRGDILGAQDSLDSFLSCRHVGMSSVSCGRVLCFPPQPGSTVVLGITPSLLARGVLEIPNSCSPTAQGTGCQCWGGRGHRSPSSALYSTQDNRPSAVQLMFLPTVALNHFFFPSQGAVISYPVFVCLFVLSFCCCLNWLRNLCLILSLLVFFPNVLGGNIHFFNLFLMKYFLF